MLCILERNIIKMALLLCIFPNPAKVSGSGGIFAGAGFLPDLEKTPDSGRYSPNVNLANRRLTTITAAKKT